MEKKWMIALMGTLTQLGLGTVYAWSFFQLPITTLSGWSNAKVAWAFGLAIFMLGITAAWGGTKLDKYGPRKLAVIGGILYAIGYFISSFALKTLSLSLLYIGFGIIGGIGLGLAYVTPVATVSRWFTTKQGLATGMVVMGFGLGALLMSKLVAPYFLRVTENNLISTFNYIGIFLLIFLPICAWFLELPKDSIKISNTENPKIQISKYIFQQKFVVLWILFLINIVAGMIFISFQSPLLQDILKNRMPSVTDFTNPETIAKLSAAGATLIAISSIFNGLGRIFWGTVSDKIGRFFSFKLLLIIQLFVFISLLFIKTPVLFSIMVCIILLCYGGGFGIIPSLVKDNYGNELMSGIYGAILTAWGVGGIIGPQIVALMKDTYGDKAGYYSFIVGSIILLIGVIISFLFSKKMNPKKAGI